MSANSVTQVIWLRASACGTGFELPATFSYSTSEPYAVRLELHADAGEPVVWVFARCLLTEGTGALAGAGDVQVWPAAGGQMVIRLMPPSGPAEFTASAVSVACFLEATYRLVAPGAEPGRTDIDAGIAGILADGGTR